MADGSFMPGPAVVAAIQADLADYNGKRTGVIERVARRSRLFLAVYAVAVVALFVALFFWMGGFGLFGGEAEIVGGVDVSRSGRDGALIVLGLVAAFGLVGGYFVHRLAGRPVRKLQQSFRETLIPRIFGFLQNVSYRKGRKPETYRDLPNAAIGNYNRRSFDDVISGEHDGMKFEAFEARFTRQRDKKRDVLVFAGIILSFDLVRGFPGILIASRANPSLQNIFADLFGFGGLKTVSAGDAEADARYQIRSDNVEAARAVVTPAFLRALDELNASWPSSAGRLTLAGNRGFVLLPTGKNFFELPDIDVACDYASHIEPMVRDMTGLLATARLARSTA
ncbi:MAG: DUF3137 domain-containing protein [Rhizobiaceae bacterium]|nr:DUF3137 domain-containing protein [Rhizobiaceae bacterium]